MLKSFFVGCMFSCLILLKAHACTCFYEQEMGFCDFVSNTELVVDAQIIDWSKMQIRIVEVLSGTAPSKKLELDWTFCSEIPKKEEGDRFILALTPSWDFEQTGKFQIPGCGIYYLQHSGDQVKGKISANRRSMPFSRFKNMLSTASCPASAPKFRIQLGKEQLILSDPWGKFEGPIAVRLLDIAGRQLLTRSIRMEKGKAETHIVLDELQLSAGIYLLYIEPKGQPAQVAKGLIR